MENNHYLIFLKRYIEERQILQIYFIKKIKIFFYLGYVDLIYFCLKKYSF